MSEAPRLRDDPAADGELRALLRDAPPTRAMPPELRAALDAKVAAIAAAPVTAALPQGLTVWAWVGVAAVAAALGGLGVGAWRASSRAHPARPAAVVRTPPARAVAPSLPAEAPAAPSMPARAATTPAPRTPSRPAAALRARAAEAPERLPVAAPVAPPPASPSPVAGASITPSYAAERRVAEHRLLDQARAALAAGRTGEALAHVATHERAFADGGMVEERELIAVEALSRAGQRDAARGRGERFLARWPGSLYAGRVRSLVGAPVDFGMAREAGVHSRSGGP